VTDGNFFLISSPLWTPHSGPPTLDDVRGAWQNLKLLSRPDLPQARVCALQYAEKEEYWALVWGMIVMAVTGIMP
jgi:hypothetical protein